jgi:hypothetical protein
LPEAQCGMQTPGAGCTAAAAARSPEHTLESICLKTRLKFKTAAAAAIPSNLHSRKEHGNNSRKPRTTQRWVQYVFRFFAANIQPCLVAGCALFAAEYGMQTSGAGCTDEAAARTPRRTLESVCLQTRPTAAAALKKPGSRAQGSPLGICTSLYILRLIRCHSRGCLQAIA